ncbi:MAG: hypothetical protein AAB823_00195 [Patescibacteria group bacterium]|mgnify:CR=1 FL=1
MGENLKDLFVNITGVKLTYHEPKSPMYPDTGVAKLKASARDALINGHTITGAQLGIGQDSDFEIRLNEAMVQDLQAALAKTAKDVYILVWDGNKTSIGAQVGGHTIGRTQNGEVVSDKGELLGTYTRLLENGGESKRKQQMIVFSTAEPIEQEAK